MDIDTESVVVRLRRHGRRLVWPVVALIVIAAASGYWIGALPEPWMNLAAAIAAPALAVVLGIGPILAWLASRATITNRRIIIRSGFFVHTRSEVPLGRVREVRSRRGPIQRLFGSGDVVLIAGVDAPFVLRDVPRPQLAVDALHELIEQGFARDLGSAAPAAVPGASLHGGNGMTTVLPRAPQ